jgi:hypothetical protein
MNNNLQTLRRAYSDEIKFYPPDSDEYNRLMILIDKLDKQILKNIPMKKPTNNFR